MWLLFLRHYIQETFWLAVCKEQPCKFGTDFVYGGNFFFAFIFPFLHFQTTVAFAPCLNSSLSLYRFHACSPLFFFYATTTARSPIVSFLAPVGHHRNLAFRCCPNSFLQHLQKLWLARLGFKAAVIGTRWVARADVSISSEHFHLPIIQYFIFGTASFVVWRTHMQHIQSHSQQGPRRERNWSPNIEIKGKFVQKLLHSRQFLVQSCCSDEHFPLGGSESKTILLIIDHLSHWTIEV